MNHQDHLDLLRDGIPTPGGLWADFGSGTGAFTLALAELIGADGQIYSIDKDAGALREQERALRTRFPDMTLHFQPADFTRPLNLPPLDGIVIANALHFLRQKDAALQSIRDYLRPGRRLIVVEYNVDHGNTWVPYPFSYPTWETLARKHGFVETRLVQTKPSRFLREIYSAVSLTPHGR